MVRDEIQIQAEKDYAVRKATEAAFAKGKAEGFAKGKAEFKAKVAKTMLTNGLSVALVSEYTGLSIEQVESIK